MAPLALDPVIVCTDGKGKTGKGSLNKALAAKYAGRGHVVKVMSGGQVYRAITWLARQAGWSREIIETKSSDEVRQLAIDAGLTIPGGKPTIIRNGRPFAIPPRELDSQATSVLIPFVAAHNQSVRRYVEHLLQGQVEGFDGVVLLDGRDAAAVVEGWVLDGLKATAVINMFVTVSDEALRQRFPGQAEAIIERDRQDAVNTVRHATATLVDNSGDMLDTVNAMDMLITGLVPDLAPVLTVLSGPSGVGKGTVVREVKAVMPQLRLTRSATTRAQRPGESPNNYDFITREEFLRRAANNEFIEWAEFAGNLYGTPRSQLSTGWCICEIEVQGAAQIHERVPEARLIRLEPPGDTLLEKLAALEARQAADVGNQRNNIDERLARVEHELAAYADKVVINDTVRMAAREIAWYI